MVYALHSLEGTYTCSVLLALYQNEMCRAKDEDLCSADLERMLETGFASIKTAVDRLEANGYVYKEQEETKPRRTFILLTPKGMAAAKHLEAMENELASIAIT